MDDKAFARLKPCFAGDSALYVWMSSVLNKAAIEYAEEFEGKEGRNADKKRILQTLQMLKDTPDAKIDFSGILGKPRKGFSWEELRDEAISEKYCI